MPAFLLLIDRSLRRRMSPTISTESGGSDLSAGEQVVESLSVARSRQCSAKR